MNRGRPFPSGPKAETFHHDCTGVAMMSNFHRRDSVTAAAAFAAATAATLVGTRQAEAGDPTFMNNVPDPLLAAKELPTF
jgi:hypothetical protein